MVPNLNRLQSTGFLKLSLPLILEVTFVIVEWIFILPIAYLLGDWLELGLLGIWIALALDEVVRGINLYLRWKSKRWQIKSKHLNQHIHASSN
jgi:Na+-driven multidrug efflux pump